jgi:hypothetical protein
MSVYFIDFQGNRTDDGMIIKELCIMDGNNLFNPIHEVYTSHIPWNYLSTEVKTTNKYLSKYNHGLYWNEGSKEFCIDCILDQLINYKNATFYVLDSKSGSKMNLLKKYFPEFRLIAYGKHLKKIERTPNNIYCIWREHGHHCAYKQCLAMALDYLKC